MSTTAPNVDDDTSVLSQAGAKAKVVAGQAQETASEVQQKAGATIRGQLDQRSNQAGEQARSIASAMRRSAQELRDQGKDGPAGLVEQLCQKVDQAGTYLSSSDSDKLLRDVEDFARRQPGMVAGGAAALGFLAARFMGASGRRRYGQGASYEPHHAAPIEPPSSELGR
jgi:hypothetical protein